MADGTPAEQLAELLELVVEAYGLEAEVSIEDDGETLRGVVDGDDLGLIIGRHGQTIDALEHLATRIAFPEGKRDRYVEVDAGGYRERRADALEEQADEAVSEAISSGQPVQLDPMSSSERRLVHEYLRDSAEVETYSEGEEPKRRLIVAPASRE
ncbi:MAG: KH domain-containing protein [Solirubrobacterales bacterium]|nr:KH domain-containing protein [Solirubrobacterales bacterium]